MIGIKQFVFRWAATTIAVMVASSIIVGSVTTQSRRSSGRRFCWVFLTPLCGRFCCPQRAGHSYYAGLVILVLNGLLLLLVPSIVAVSCGQLLERVLGAIVISFVSWVLSAFFRGSDDACMC